MTVLPFHQRLNQLSPEKFWDYLLSTFSTADIWV
jgi:hypothetical protein